MIKNLIFDFGMVLVRYDYRKFFQTIFDDNSEIDEFEKVFCSYDFVQRNCLGDDALIDIIREYQARYPKWKNQIQQYHDRALDAITVEMPGMREILMKLRKSGYKLYGLTNWNSTVYPTIEKFDILQMLDDRLISSEEHLVKPDAAIYERLCDKFNLVKSECLFTDDSQINVDGAIAYGMPAVLFTDA